ncbi:LytTR family DNA-binding domain-containing protein [Flavitalea sp. BT771]|uniref:LytR/AlgR family response regulator transcription factor n=1 Tax=Flavitalea sp. BT771 TaxID=3063329 RepID=UPI0026E38756|nr:LytTR family DNA-binding domain-containing protein [Flavitalea sp. BT771]MDO6433936.1 LytTR family DNA-binding domain-containing protein [Flavitalea sp. BT771]MDV6222837.1 LytTR family DNA-binding domain-containing protein [Flavitalea sp. BT771]
MQPLNAIIVDDNFNSLQNLRQKLAEFCPDIKVLAVTQSPEEAITLLRQLHPDVLFLDIEMPRMNGFRMLDELDEYDFDVVFTTAYNHYAIDAIRISAFDYLTKPIAIKDLQQAVERLIATHDLHTRQKLELLRQSFTDAKSQEDRIAIPTGEGLEFIPISLIARIESSSNYAKIFLTDGRNLVVTRLLKDFEAMLQPYHFYRIHHSHLVNLKYVRKYIRGDGGQVVMENGDVIDVARRKKEDFLKLFAI